MINKVPSGIEWVRARRVGKRGGGVTRLTAYTDEAGRRQVRLTVSGEVLEKAGFKLGDRLQCLQGREPHSQWLRIEKTSEGGVFYRKEKTPVFSIGSYIITEAEVVEDMEPQIGKDAIYFELRKKWVK